MVVRLAVDHWMAQAYVRDYMYALIRNAAAESELLFHEIRVHDDLVGATIAKIEHPLRSLLRSSVAGMVATVVDR